MKRMATDKEPMSTAFHLALEEMAVVASWNKNETTQRYRLLFSRASNPCATNARIREQATKDDLGARAATEISRTAYTTDTSGGTEMLFKHS